MSDKKKREHLTALRISLTDLAFDAGVAQAAIHNALAALRDGQPAATAIKLLEQAKEHLDMIGR